jgi:GlpG protein
MIGHLPAEAQARRFVDYLLSRRMVAHAEESSAGAWELWVEDDDNVDAGRAELQQFTASPDDPKYDAADEADRLRREQAKAAEKRRRNYRDVRTTVLAAPQGAIPVAMALIGLSVALYVITHYGGPTGDKVSHYLLFDNPIDNPPRVAGPRGAMFDSILHGQVWRLVTPIFLHGSILHILFNMMWMLDLGRRIEPNKGSGRFAVLVLVIAAVSCLAEAVWSATSPWNSDHYSVFLGMSGVVSGLFGYAWMCGRYRPYERIGVSQYETGLMLGWLVICTFGFVGPIANAAHWGGLLVGMALGAGPSLMRRRKG